MHGNAHLPFLCILNYFTITLFLKIHYYVTYSSSVWHDVECYHFAMFLRGCEINRKCIVFWFRSNSVLWICLQPLSVCVVLFNGVFSWYCCWREFLLPRITCSLVVWLFLREFLLKRLVTVRRQGVFGWRGSLNLFPTRVFIFGGFFFFLLSIQAGTVTRASERKTFLLWLPYT